ncbi:MAG: hypothetical protein JW928_03790 [Candidatus Aureabacteria bacterium]|nr:hypothetical protein [Candidatus Auribacterota bacterium]
MKNKVFIFSFAGAVFLNIMFFTVLRIQSPKVISIMESEVYLMDDVSESGEMFPDMSESDGAGAVTPFFSLPGVYQKIYSPEMKYKVDTLKDESALPEYDPFSEDQKIVSKSMDFVPEIRTAALSLTRDLVSREKECLEKWGGGRAKGEGRVLLTESLKGYFDESVIQESFLSSGISLQGELAVHIVFFSKNSFSVMIKDGPSDESLDPFQVNQAFQKAFKKNHAYVPEKLYGKISREPAI